MSGSSRAWASVVALCSAVPVLVPVLVIGAGLSACSSGAAPAGRSGDAATSPDAATTLDAASTDAGPLPEASCDGAHSLTLARQTRWPGGGAELTVRVDDADGFAAPEYVAHCLVRKSASDLDEVMHVTPAAQAPGFTLVVLPRLSAALGRSAALGALARFFDKRPEAERIGILGWGVRLVTVANFSHDRAWLRAQAALWYSDYPTGEGADAAADIALERARDEVMGIGGEGPTGMRALVVFGADGTPPKDALDSVKGPVLQWISTASSDEATERLGSGRSIAIADHASARAALVEASSRLDSFAASAFYQVGLCGDGSKAEIDLGIRGRKASFVWQLDSSPDDIRAMDCAFREGPVARRPVTPAIDLVFSDAQRAVFDERLAANSKDDFTVGVRAWPTSDIAPATAHLRGRGSLGCGRRNYTLNFDGGDPRHLIEGAANDEWYLLSMCLDDRYINTLFGFTMMQRTGSFPIPFRLVELKINGTTRGVYMLIEKVAESLVQSNMGLRSVIRRGTDILGKPEEIKYAEGTDAAALEGYSAVLEAADGLAGDALLDALRAHMDIETYLRWIALMTLVRNGDYIDEVWFYGARSLSSAGEGTRFSVVGWDPDDLDSSCHYEGGNALSSPHDLLYCTESKLDHAILGDPVVFDLYVEQLQALMAGPASKRVFAETFDAVAEQLLPWFDDPLIAGAMYELLRSNPAASDPAVAKADIQDAIATLKRALAAWRKDLEAGVDAYRAEQGGG